MGIGETLQTKAGPLPVWAWGVGGGVGLALLLRMRGAGGANPVGPVVLQPGSMGGGLSVNSPTDQGTGGADLGTALAGRTAVRDPTTFAVTQLWDTTDQGSVIGRFYAPGQPMFSAANRYGAGWDSQAQTDAQGTSPSSPAPSPAQVAQVTTPTYTATGATVLPSYNSALDHLRSLVGWDAQSRVNSWVNDAINNAKSRGQWGAGNVTDANLRAIALGGVKWQQEEKGLTDPTASGYDLSGFASNTLNPGQAVDFLLAGGTPNRYALDYSRYSESGRPLTALHPVGV